MTQPRRPPGRPDGGHRSSTARPEPDLHLTTGWPPVGYEDRDWASTIDEGHLDVWQRLKTARPYQAAVPPFIADLDPRLRPDALTAALEATNEVTRFDTEMAGLPVPMPAVLLRTESASSSQIEHLTSNARNIALAELGGPGKENAALIVANARAITTALNAGGTVTPDTILAIHAALLQAAEPEHAGTWRDQQVWIGSSPISPHDADFIPPHADRVPELIDDLTAFGRRSDVPPLVHAAPLHAVANGRQLANDILTIRQQWRDQIKARTDSSAWRLADQLFAQPVINVDRATTDLGVSAPAARASIATLVDAGVLTPTSDARRNRAWQATSVLTAIDEFSRRAGRRTAGR